VGHNHECREGEPDFQAKIEMENNFYGELSVICMPGCEKFVDEVDSYLHEWRGSRGSTSFVIKPECKTS
jgi:hypothetical protein